MERTEFTGPHWEQKEGVVARGRAFDNAGSEVDLKTAFAETESYEAVVDTATDLTGFFAVVIRTTDELILVCDHARSIPLYFTTTPQLSVSDTASTLVETTQLPAVDPIAESEFVLTRYVTCGETLLPEIHSVRAGEAVRIPRDTPAAFDRRRYDTYHPTTRGEGNIDTFRTQIADVLDTVFDRTAAIIGDRPVAIPLSGGIDSRLVATMLVERDCEVIGFTFGCPGHTDVEVSRTVAANLGIDWEWVEYSTDRWYDWYHSPDRRAYHDFAFNYDSLPFLAEWPAVRTLLSDGRLPGNAIVCPGHTVATPSERVPARWLDNDPSRQEVIESILEEHYSLWEWDDPELRDVFADRIAADAALEQTQKLTGGEAAAAYERWEWTTRMATFTNGDLRVYDWFELDWWLPLWDPAYVQFWETVPLSSRHRKRLQTEFTVQRYADVAGIEPAAARQTDRDWTAVDQLRRTFATDPVASVTRGFDDLLGVQATPRAQWEAWGNYPLGWYGIIPENQYDRFGAATNLYALRTLAALGYLELEPPSGELLPLKSQLDLPLSRDGR